MALLLHWRRPKIGAGMWPPERPSGRLRDEIWDRATAPPHADGFVHRQRHPRQVV